jgi:hypothetical protein
MYASLLSRVDEYRLSKSIVAPVFLGLATAASYSSLPRLSLEEAPYQAAWVATGICLSSALLQAAIELREEVITFTIH